MEIFILTAIISWIAGLVIYGIYMIVCDIVKYKAKKTARHEISAMIDSMKKSEDILLFIENEKKLNFLQERFRESYPGARCIDFDYSYYANHNKFISFAEKHLAEFKEQLKKSSGSSCLPYMKKVDLALERAYKEGTPLYELDDEFVDLKKEFNLANLYYLRRLYRQE